MIVTMIVTVTMAVSGVVAFMVVVLVAVVALMDSLMGVSTMDMNVNWLAKVLNFFPQGTQFLLNYKISTKTNRILLVFVFVC